MKQFKCEICGGTSIIQIDEKTYECQDCGLQYDVAEVETLIVLPQEVVEEPAELTVEEQEDLQPTFDVPQELEDSFTKEVEAEQVTEEIALETDSETFPEYIKDISIESAESEETDNSIAIEEEPQPEAAEETADEISIVASEIDGIEDVVSENEDKSEETEVDEQKEAVKSNAIIPWYKNKKIIIPSIAGIVLALVAVVLLIVLLPKGNIPISDDNSSDIQSTVESSQVESTQEPSESIVESSVSNSSKEESNKPTTNSVSSNSVSNADPYVVTKVENYGTSRVEYNARGDIIKSVQYHDNGNICYDGTWVFYGSNGKSFNSTNFQYAEDGTKILYSKGKNDYDSGNGTATTERYYTEGIHKGKISCIESENYNIVDGGNAILYIYKERIEYIYNDNGTYKEIYTYKSDDGTFLYKNKAEVFDENGNKTYYSETDANGNVIKEIFYDENGNEIQS